MRYLMAAIALAILSAAARPPAWRLAATSHLVDPPATFGAAFVDTASITRNGDSVSYKSLTIWEPNRSRGDNARSRRVANCRSHQYQIGQISYYKGDVFIENGTMDPVTAAGFGTATDREIDAVCGATAWLTKKVADPFSWSRTAFSLLRRGGYWPLEVRRYPKPGNSAHRR